MKYEFLSRPWFAALHGIITEKARNAARADAGFRYSICEVFTGVPKHLAATPDGKAAWYALIEGGDVRFGLGEREDTDFKAVVDYVSVLPLARFDTMDEPDRVAELQASSAALAAQGHLTAIGIPPSVHSSLADLHDAIARLTE